MKIRVQDHRDGTFSISTGEITITKNKKFVPPIEIEVSDTEGMEFRKRPDKVPQAVKIRIERVKEQDKKDKEAKK